MTLTPPGTPGLLGRLIDEVEAKVEEAEVEEAQEEQAQAEGGQTPPKTPLTAKPPRPTPITPKRENDLRRALEDEKGNARTANLKRLHHFDTCLRSFREALLTSGAALSPSRASSAPSSPAW